jgi:hypothetical protein
MPIISRAGSGGRSQGSHAVALGSGVSNWRQSLAAPESETRHLQERWFVITSWRFRPPTPLIQTPGRRYCGQGDERRGQHTVVLGNFTARMPTRRGSSIRQGIVSTKVSTSTGTPRRSRGFLGALRRIPAPAPAQTFISARFHRVEAHFRPRFQRRTMARQKPSAREKGLQLLGPGVYPGTEPYPLALRSRGKPFGALDEVSQRKCGIAVLEHFDFGRGTKCHCKDCRSGNEAREGQARSHAARMPGWIKHA